MAQSRLMAVKGLSGNVLIGNLHVEAALSPSQI